MKGLGKRMLAILMSLMMVASVITPTAFADETVPETSPIETVEETKQTEAETPSGETETTPETSQETQAPETEAPSKETETPAPETEAPSKETEAPATETEEPAKEDPTEPAKEDPTEPAKEDPTEPAKEDPTEPAKEDPTEPAKEDPTEPAKEDPTEPAKEDPTEPAKEDPTEPAKEDPTEPAKEDPTEPAKEDPTEPAKEDPTEPAEEPEQVQPKSFTSYVGKLRVIVRDDNGALPMGTKMKVVPVDVEDLVNAAMDGNVKIITAVDISFWYEGEEIEPNGPVAVDIRAAEKADDVDNVQVLHIDDDNNVTEVEDVTAKQGKSNLTTKFETDEFSVYIVIESVVPRLTVQFMNGSSEIATMYVKDADTEEEVEKIIYDPGAGELPNGQVFKGWTTEQNYTAKTKFLTIDDIRSAAMTTADGLSADSSVTYYAAVFKQYTVTYVDGEGITVGTEVTEIPARETNATYTINQGYSTDDSHNFEGWHVADGLSNIVSPSGSTAETLFENETQITIKGNVKFSVSAPEGHWLIFDENGKGATYNAPRFIKAGDVTSDEGLITMVRNGYVFGGWYTDKNCTDGNEFTFGGAISETTTIYAKWTQNETANYTVLIWKQHVDGESYDFKESVIVRNAAVGSTPTAVNTTNGRVTGGTYAGETGFHFKETDQASKTVATEGNTVVNVYWDRNEITFNFNLYSETYTPTTSDSGTQYGIVDGEYVELYRWNGNWYYGYYNRYRGTRYTRSAAWSVYKTMSGLYGSTLEANNYEWPTEYDWYSGYNNQNVPNGTRTTFLDAFLPTSTATTVEFYGRSPEGSNHIYFYKQKADGNGYELANTVNTNATGFNLSDKYNGFKCVAWNATNNTSNWQEVGELMNQSGQFYYDAKPGQSGYQTADINSNTGLHVYFDRLSYSLNFMDGGYFDGNGNPIEETNHGQWKDVADITYGASLTSYNKGGDDYYEPTAPAGYVFEGWYIDDACTHPYTFSTMPEGGLTVYAKWRQIQIRVFLHPNAGTDPTLDWGSDEQDMNFRVNYGGQVSAPTGLRTGYDFYGWYTDPGCTQAFSAARKILSGTAYDKTTDFTDPMDKWGNGATTNGDLDRFWITEKFDLYAKWSEIIVGADGIGIVYNANGGTNAPSDTALYKDNSSVSAGAAPTAPTGKLFDHWVLQTWNGTAYVDTDITVSAGGTFTALKDDAKITDASTGAVVAEADVIDDNDHHYNYTIQLKAVYKDKEEETPTHIDWYSNYGSENDGKGTLYHSNTGIKINEAVDILGAQTRDGYEFKGWTKTKGGTTADFLVWTGSGYTDVDGHTATQVAADEKQPYEDLFAVWEEKEVTINYAVASDSTDMGAVDPTSETVKVDTGTAAGSTATAASTTYVFDYWTVDDGTESISEDEHYTPAKENGLYVAHTYYAHFKLNKAPVTVHHYLKGTTTKVAEDVTSQEVIGSEYTAQPVTEYQGKSLTVDTASSDDLTVTVRASGNVINIYYTLPLTIEASTASKTYDGTPLNGAYTITGALESDAEAIETAIGTAPSITHVSESPKTYQATVTDIPGYYVVTNTPGTLTISPRTVTLKSETASKAYDGSPLTRPDVTVGGDGFVAGEATAAATGTITEVGTVTNTIVVTEGTGFKADNYTITKDEGTLTITQSEAAIVVVAGNGSKTYDGTPLTQADAEKETVTGIPEGFTYEIVTAGTITDVGTTENAITSFKILKGEQDVTSQFSDITKTNGTLEVTKATLTIKTESANKEYDGTALTANGTITGFVNNETATFTVIGSQTEVGKSTNGYTLVFDKTAVATNYTISENLGTLEVTKSTKELKVESANGEWTYDGTAHTNKTYTVTYGTEKIEGTEGQVVFTLSTGDKVTITPATTATITHAAETTVDNAFTWTVENENFYTKGADTVGKLTVNPVELKIVTNSAEKEYDGKALTADGTATFGTTETALKAGEDVTVTLVGTESIKVKITGTQTPMGNSQNTYEITWGTVASTDYKVTETVGKLNVKKNTTELAVKSADGEWTYDTTAHTNKTYTVTYGDEVIEGTEGQVEFTLSTGDKVTVTPDAAATITHVAETTVDNAFTWNVTNADFYTKGEDTVGKLTVKPAELTITTDSANKEYDGEALTADGKATFGTTDTALKAGEDVTVALAGTETVKVKITGTQTPVGDSQNTYEITWGTVASTDYKVNETLGTLKVTKSTKELSVESADGEWTYDGAAHTNKTYTVTYGTETIKGTEGQVEFTLSTGDKVTVTPATTATITHVAESDVDNAFTWTVENENFYTKGADKVGKLTVNPATLTIKTESAEKEYDGTALTANGTITGFVNNETATFKVTGSQIVVGKSNNTYSLTWDGTAVQTDYTLSETIGTLEVTKSTKELSVDSLSNSWTYNGAAHVDYRYEIHFGEDEKVTVSIPAGQASGTGELSTGDVVTITPAASATITHVDETTVNNAFTWTVENQNYYTIGKDTVGTLSITPATLTINTGSDTKEYDGTALTKDGTATFDEKDTELKAGVDTTVALAGTDTIKVKVTGTQTVVGKSTNDYTITWGDTKSTDYTIAGEKGTLEVTKSTKELKVVSKDGEWTYDTVAHTKYEYTVTYGDESYDVIVAEGAANGTATLSTGDVVTITPAAAATITHAADSDVDNEFGYTVTHSDMFAKQEKEVGALTVNPAALTINTESAEKEYDGKALTAPGEATFGETKTALEAGKDVEVALAGSEKITVKITGTQTTVGESTNDYTITWGDVASTDYTVSGTKGTLKITASTKEVKIVSKDGEWTYDGDAHTKYEYTVTYGDETYNVSVAEGGTTAVATLSTGDKVTITPADSATITHVAESDVNNAFTYVLDNADQYATKNTEEGALTVNPATLTIVTESDEKEYDGTPLTADGSISGFVKDETATFEVTGTITKVGEVENSYSLTFDKTAVETDYTLSEDLGTLKITQSTKEVKIVSKDGEWTYDGDAHTKYEYTVTYGEETYNVSVAEGGTTAVATLSTGDKVTITPADTATITHVAEGEVANAFTYVLDNDDQYKTKTTEEGELTVNPATLTIETESDEKEYDGTPLTAEGSISGFVKEETATFEVTGTITYVGEEENSYSLTWDGTATETDYVLDEDLGTLKITQSTKEFTITSSDSEWVYDGEEHTKYEYTVKYGDDFEEVVTVAEGEENVTVTLPTGDTVTITPDDSAKIKNVRESDVDNSFTFTVKNGDKDTSGQFKTITPVSGTLTVTKKDLLITVGDTSVKYDGEEHEGFGQNVGTGDEDVQFVTLVDGQIGTITYTPAKGTLVGEYVGEFDKDTLKIVAPVTMTQSGSLRGFKLSQAEDLEGEDVTDNYEVTYKEGLLDITDGSEEDPVDPSLVVTKEVDDKKYDLGEEIEFTVTATNIYKDAKTITLTEIDGVTLDKSVFENVPGGETVTTTARYTVKEANILAGSFTNTVKASFNEGIEAEAEATANTADKNSHLTVEKEATSEPENGETYALGEKITWKITVTNDGNVTISNITVTDELTGDEWTVKSLAPGESKEFEAEYTVTEDDILAGKVENTADATGEDPDGEDPDVDPGTDEEPTDPKNSHLTVEKVATSEPKNGTGYAEGEKITWKITVTNDGNMTIKNITVTDELTGDEWTIDSLAPGDSKEFEAEYTVTADDVKEGSVTNTATATGEDPEGDEPDVDPGTDDEPTVNPKAHLTVKKVATSTPKNGKKYDEGETITWKITVVNDGEVEVTDIKVEDKLTDDEWTIDSLQPGESKEFKAEYTVTKADKSAGKVVNTATATGKVPGGGKPDVTPGKDEQPVVPAETVQTGDDTNMWLWTILMAASSVSMGAIMLTAKKRRTEEE